MNKDLIEKNLSKIQEKPESCEELEKNIVIAITKSSNCIFLTKDKKCAIYEDRPEVCKLYGTSKTNQDLMCPYLKHNGNKRSKADQKKIDRYCKNLLKNKHYW
jgi:Fe-S-cluster containining protein